MTNSAGKLCPVKPMIEDDRSHTCFFGIIIQYYFAIIFGLWNFLGIFGLWNL
jgi:hypothetical protein